VYGCVLNLSQPSILSCLAPVRGRLGLCLMCIHCTLDVCQYPSQPGAFGSSNSAPHHFEWDRPGFDQLLDLGRKAPSVEEDTTWQPVPLTLQCGESSSWRTGKTICCTSGWSLKELDWPEKIPLEINGGAVPEFLNWSRINQTPWEHRKQQRQISHWCNHKLWNIQVLGWLMATDSQVGFTQAAGKDKWGNILIGYHCCVAVDTCASIN